MSKLRINVLFLKTTEQILLLNERLTLLLLNFVIEYCESTLRLIKHFTLGKHTNLLFQTVQKISLVCKQEQVLHTLSMLQET